MGVFAKANIPRGTRVISEQALLEVTLNNIVPAFERLPPSQQEPYLELHGYLGDLLKLAVKERVGRNYRNYTAKCSPSTQLTPLAVFFSALALTTRAFQLSTSQSTNCSKKRLSMSYAISWLARSLQLCILMELIVPKASVRPSWTNGDSNVPVQHVRMLLKADRGTESGLNCSSLIKNS